MITLEADRLVFRFPEVHEDAACAIEFQRTLRIPDDERTYPLPPGLGCFPLRHIDDHAERIPGGWLKRGGVVMPMHQSEAMWLMFWSLPKPVMEYPCAIKIATGKVSAITGEPWVQGLNRDPQDYLVVPDQPWLDGYCVEKGTIRQFVAMPLGDGYSAEEQITGAAEHGGLQILVYPMKAERYEALKRERSSKVRSGLGGALSCGEEDAAMGLAPGGRMKQEIYDDPYGLEAWDLRHSSRCFVSIANSLAWFAVTGERPPTRPPLAADYTAAGLPWFDYYGGDVKAIKGAKALAELKSVKELGQQKGEAPLPENQSVEVTKIHKLGPRKRKAQLVREAEI